MSDNTKTIMERLKEETWPQHQAAERQDLEKQLIGGQLAKELFVDYLGQRYLLHKALEAKLRELRASDARIAELATDRRMHEPRLADDIAFYGSKAESIEPLPATTRLIGKLNDAYAKQPISIMGMFYVTEGSTNGASFIARAIKGAYRLSDEKGTAFLDPYGAEIRPMWGQFKDTMNAQDFTDAEKDAMVAVAGETFNGIMEIDQELMKDSAAAK